MICIILKSTAQIEPTVIYRTWNYRKNIFGKSYNRTFFSNCLFLRMLKYEILTLYKLFCASWFMVKYPFVDIWNQVNPKISRHIIFQITLLPITYRCQLVSLASTMKSDRSEGVFNSRRSVISLAIILHEIKSLAQIWALNIIFEISRFNFERPKAWSNNVEKSEW